jgi:uncharacterized protein YneF (UPF0154 family)
MHWIWGWIIGCALALIVGVISGLLINKRHDEMLNKLWGED